VTPCAEAGTRDRTGETVVQPARLFGPVCLIYPQTVPEPADRPMRRTRLEAADLGAAWREHAGEFIAWAGTPGHDSYWRFHRDLFFELLPQPGRRTLDLGCGEGRVARDLVVLGHAVVGIDAAPAMVEAAREATPGLEVHLADAAALPFEDGTFDLVVAFMSLQDIDDMEGAVRESARVLQPGGRMCLAIVHPINSAGAFNGLDGESPFVIDGSYLDRTYSADEISRNGLDITFVSEHRPIQAYTDALAAAGFLIERLREPPVPEAAVTSPRNRRWQRLPLFLHMAAVKPASPLIPPPARAP
jgi:SAM-dependent methyltransferase